MSGKIVIGKELEDILIVADMGCPYSGDERNIYLVGVEKGLAEGVDLAIRLLQEASDGFNT